MTWCEYIGQALLDLGGSGHLSNIYIKVAVLQAKNGKKKIKSFKDSINGILEKNSRGMGHDIFYPIGGTGRGYWGLTKKGMIKTIF